MGSLGWNMEAKFFWKHQLALLKTSTSREAFSSQRGLREAEKGVRRGAIQVQIEFILDFFRFSISFELSHTLQPSGTEFGSFVESCSRIGSGLLSKIWELFSLKYLGGPLWILYEIWEVFSLKYRGWSHMDSLKNLRGFLFEIPRGSPMDSLWNLRGFL